MPVLAPDTATNSQHSPQRQLQQRRRRQRTKPLLPSSTRPGQRHHLPPNHPSSTRTTTTAPPGTSTSTKTTPLPSKSTRALIRTHHTLSKSLARAQRDQDGAMAEQIRKELKALGGLKRYQDASLAGQRKERGGDTGGVLVQWLVEAGAGALPGGRLDGEVQGGRGKKSRSRGLRLLEVGVLSADSACARSGIFSDDGAVVDGDGGGEGRLGLAGDSETDKSGSSKKRKRRDAGIVRIDLSSREPEIREVDFMEMQPPSPKTAAEGLGNGRGRADQEREGFDVVSLSLVVNFVGDPSGRGDMLRRVALFFRGVHTGKKQNGTMKDEQEKDAIYSPEARISNAGPLNAEGGGDANEKLLLPALFLVLPAPCVTNSRYLDEDRLTAIMQSLGYVQVRRKMSAKLVFYLWRYDRGVCLGGRSRVEGSQHHQWRKEEIRKGKDRNNFAIVLK